MGSGKHRWKFSFHSHRSSPSSSSTNSPQTAPPSPFSIPPFTSADFPPSPPSEFLCPISGELMFDPVIIPSGQTFERSCIQSCLDLNILPPITTSSSSSSSSSTLLLIPNGNLRSAILSWCDRSGFPYPSPVPSDRAKELVQLLVQKNQIPPAIEALKQITNESFSSSSTATTTTRNTLSSASSSSYFYSSSSSWSTEIVSAESEEKQKSSQPPEVTQLKDVIQVKNKILSLSEEESGNCSSPSSPAPVIELSLEDEILANLRDSNFDSQESTLSLLLQATRESNNKRIELCKPRVLLVLRNLLHSRNSSVQANAAAALANLSIEQSNKIAIVRAGVVPAVVQTLRTGTAEVRDHAAGALFSLSVDAENRSVLGVLGAIPPLLVLFCRPSEPLRARRDSGMALYYLSLSSSNRSKIARAPASVKSLLSITAEERSTGLPCVALMVLCNVAGSAEGRTVMMDSGVVAGLVSLMGDSSLTPEERYRCVAALYGMSLGSLRFRGLARAAGAEAALEKAAGMEDSSKATKEMAARTLGAVRGEENVDEIISLSSAGSSTEGSVVSEGALSFRQRVSEDFSSAVMAGVVANSAEF